MKANELDGITCVKAKLKIIRPPLSDTTKYLVLESDPNPDYYALHNFPPNKEHANVRHLYLLVKNTIHCFQDVILRNTHQLREQFGSTMFIYPGSMSFQNKDYQCIRIDTTSVDQLPKLIEALQELGLVFLKDRKAQDYTSLVQYKKYIEYLEIEDGVYQDKYDTNRFFFEINSHIDFEKFLEGMVHIKNKCEFHLFDSFLTEIFIKDKVYDFIGIYSKHCDKARFGELKQEIKKTF
jgi:hypothetical protein